MGYAPFAVLAMLVIIYGVYRSGYVLDLLPETMVRRLLRQPSVSTMRKYGIVFTVRLRWHDDIGKPIVAVDDDRVRHVWALLDIEVRNLDPVLKRVSELYLEIKAARFPRRVIAIADPVRVDTDEKWYGRKFPRRVEWLLEPVSAAVAHNVRFSREWSATDTSAPRDPKRFSAAVVAELGHPGRRVRVELGEDILG